MIQSSSALAVCCSNHKNVPWIFFPILSLTSNKKIVIHSGMFIKLEGGNVIMTNVTFVVIQTVQARNKNPSEN